MADEKVDPIIPAVEPKVEPAKAAEPAVEPSLLDEGKEKLEDKSLIDEGKDDKTDPTKVDPKAEPKAVVPEKYADPTLPKDYELNKEVLEKFNADAKAMGLTQEQYQTLIDRQIEVSESQKQATMAQFKATVDGWKEEAKKELGADYQKELRYASAAVDKVFADPKANTEFRDMLRDTGLGNWPPMIKFCTYVGKQIGDDTLVDGKPAGHGLKTLAQMMYPDMASIAG